MINVNDTELGEYLEKILKEKKYSIRKAAIKTGISASYISKVINHKIDANPKTETLDKISSGLKLNRNEVYEKAGKERPDKDDNFDIGEAIDNDQYMTNHGKQLTDKEKAMLKALFGE